VQQLASSAPTPNTAHRSASDFRTLASTLTKASSAIGAIITRPKTKPPCRLAHSAINGSIRNGGASWLSAAAIMPPIHATMSGNASTCGRARICGAVSASAAATKTSAAVSLKVRLKYLASSANVAALAAAASTTGPFHPNHA